MFSRSPLAGLIGKVAHTRRAGLLAYAGLAAVDTLAALAGRRRVRRITKPALMPVLAAATAAPAGDKRVGAALALSGVGDTALLGDSRVAFLTGAASFAGAHANYLGAIAGLGNRPGMLRYRPWLALPYAAGMIGFAVALPKVARRTGWAEALAGFGYAGLVSAVAVAALDLKGRRPGQDWNDAANLAAAGGALFVASDALVGWQRYRRTDSPVLDAAVMASYTAAQGLLAVGLTNLAAQDAQGALDAPDTSDLPDTPPAA